MATNKQPIFSSAPDIQWAASILTTANTAVDGTGTTLLIFTADATNGGYLQRVIARPLGTNVATVLRLFINNGSTPSTAANNSLIMECTCTATTASQVAAIQNFEMPLNIAVPAGYKIYATVGTTISAGLQLTAIGGKY